MADSDLPGLSALAGADLASGDLLHVVDVSDTSAAADGTDKKLTASGLVTGLNALGLASDAEVSTAVSNHAAAADPHGDRAYALGLVDDLSGVSNAATARTNLGLGSAAQENTSAFEAAGAVATHSSDTTNVHGIADTSALLDSSDIGVTVQGYDSDLAAIAALAPSNDDVVQRKAGVWTNRTLAQLITDLAALGTTFQPLDSDLTAIAALSTTSTGRSLLVAADAAALRAIIDSPSNGEAILDSIVDAKGDLLTATAADTPARLAVGTNGYRLVADSSAATGLKWEAETHVVSIQVTDPNGDALATGDGKAYFRVPSTINGCNLVGVAAHVTTVSSSGTPTIQVHNVTQAADMLSTRVTIDANEKDSKDATAAAVIDTGNDDVATGDELRVDVDVAGTGTKGLIVELQFRLP